MLVRAKQATTDELAAPERRRAAAAGSQHRGPDFSVLAGMVGAAALMAGAVAAIWIP